MLILHQCVGDLLSLLHELVCVWAVCQRKLVVVTVPFLYSSLKMCLIPSSHCSFWNVFVLCLVDLLISISSIKLYFDSNSVILNITVRWFQKTWFSIRDGLLLPDWELFVTARYKSPSFGGSFHNHTRLPGHLNTTWMILLGMCCHGWLSLEKVDWSHEWKRCIVIFCFSMCFIYFCKG